jgi:Asp-tRNA(Asn)/Glu-tRNA(Gln) amidotransferase A subunit family amidase
VWTMSPPVSPFATAITRARSTLRRSLISSSIPSRVLASCSCCSRRSSALRVNSAHYPRWQERSAKFSARKPISRSVTSSRTTSCIWTKIVRPRVLAGRDVAAAQYLAAQRRKRDFDAVFAGVDAVLTPTLHTVAIPVQEIDQTTQPSHFTRFANLLDLCAMSIPNGFSADGLPIGLQIVCPASTRSAWRCMSGESISKPQIGTHADRPGDRARQNRRGRQITQARASGGLDQRANFRP